MVKPIHVALAGAGAFGQKHLDALKLIDGVKVTSVIGRELDKTQEVAAKYGIGQQPISTSMVRTNDSPAPSWKFYAGT